MRVTTVALSGLICAENVGTNDVRCDVIRTMRMVQPAGGEGMQLAWLKLMEDANNTVDVG